MRLSRKARAALDKIPGTDHADARSFAELLLEGAIGAERNRDMRLANLCRSYLVLHIKAWPSDFE